MARHLIPDDVETVVCDATAQTAPEMADSLSEIWFHSNHDDVAEEIPALFLGGELSFDKPPVGEVKVGAPGGRALPGHA